MKNYTEGTLVRMKATFSQPVDTETHFELDDEIIHYGDPPDSGEESPLLIVRDPNNPKICWVDIDTFGLVGEHECHFYNRGEYKAGEKRKFKVV